MPSMFAICQLKPAPHLVTIQIGPSLNFKMFSELNQDCVALINQYSDISALSILMKCGKMLNKEAMDAVGTNYRGVSVPKRGLMHMGRIFNPKRRLLTRGVLPGHAESVMRTECAICHKKCTNITTYGFVAHIGCIGKREVPVATFRGSIMGAVVPHFLPNMRTRMAMRKKDGKMTYMAFGIVDEIPGIFPKEHTLTHFFDTHVVEIQKAGLEARRDRMYLLNGRLNPYC